MPLGPVQIIPPGLLGFLQLKNMGKNPQLIPDSYQPTIEMRDWLFLARYEEVSVTITGGISVGYTEFNGGDIGVYSGVVPDNEAWWLVGITARTRPMIATESCQMEIAWSQKNGALSSQRPISIGPTSPRVVGQAPLNQTRAICSAGQLFLPPGAWLGIYALENVALSAMSISADLRMVRLRL